MYFGTQHTIYLAGFLFVCPVLFSAVLMITIHFNLVFSSDTSQTSSAFQKPFTDGKFLDVSSYGTTRAAHVQTPKPFTVAEPSDELSSTETSGIFQCPNDGCTKVYQRYSAMEKHLLYGKCELEHERLTLLDRAKLVYHEKLSKGTSETVTIQGDVDIGSTASSQPREVLHKGWALKKARKPIRFSEAVRKYLEEKFKIGKETGHKLDAASVARDMRFARGPDGTRLFDLNDFLTEQQVTSYFSRLTGKRRHQPADNEIRIPSEDEEAAIDEQNFADVRSIILREVQLGHPITCDNYNICLMYRQGKLTGLSVAMLRRICAYFDLDIEPLLNAKRLHTSPFLANWSTHAVAMPKPKQKAKK